MNDLIRRIDKNLKVLLTPARYAHTFRVRSKILDLGSVYGEDLGQLEIIALMHDYCKENEAFFLNKYKEEWEEFSFLGGDFKNPHLVHGPLAALVLKEEYGIYSKEVLDALIWHTTGSADFKILGKLLFLADKIEEGRSFSGVEELRHLAEQDLDLACYKLLKNNIRYLLEREENISQYSIEWYNQYSIDLKEGQC